MIRNGSTVMITIDATGNAGAPFQTDLFKNGAAGAAANDGTVTDNGDGSLAISLDATDTDTNGDLFMRVKDSGGNAFWNRVGTVFTEPLGTVANDGSAALLFDNLALQSSTVEALTLSSGAGFAAAKISGDTNAVQLTSNGDAIGIVTINANTVAIKHNAVDLLVRAANTLLDLANGIESGYTLKQMLRLSMAALMGKSSLAGGTRKYRNPGDTKDRITATTDVIGQRTAVTLDPT